MADFLLLGLELGLYDPHEYTTVFHYGEYLLGLCFRHLHGLFTARPKEAMPVQSGKKAKDVKGPNGKKSRQAPEIALTPGAPQFILNRLSWNRMVAVCCSGL
jgi:hypothetical protein